MERWTSRAIRSSIKQLYGAERHLRKAQQVRAKDGSGWLHLPKGNRRRVHRIAIALGSRGEIPIADGDQGRGFVHVLDEAGLNTLLSELDTVTDFADYLRRTEAFLDNTRVVVFGLENLLGLYLQNGRSYPVDTDLMIVQDDIWQRLVQQDDFQRRKAADGVSYLWDRMIEHIIRMNDPDLTEQIGNHHDRNPALEQVTRIMARETRFARRLLAQAFEEFHKAGTLRSRIVPSPSGVVYVYLARPLGWDRIGANPRAS